MDKQTMVQSLYNGVLFSHKYEQTIVIHSNSDDSQRLNREANLKWLHTEWFHLYDSCFFCLFFFVVFTTATECGSSRARDQTHATAVTLDPGSLTHRTTEEFHKALLKRQKWVKEKRSVVANGKGWREGGATMWEHDGVVWVDAPLLYPDVGGIYTCLKNSYNY